MKFPFSLLERKKKIYMTFESSNTNSTKDIFDDVYMILIDDYSGDSVYDHETLMTTESIEDSSHFIEMSDPLPIPKDLSKNKNIIKSNFTELIFHDYENSVESLNSLESHFQFSQEH